MKDILVKLPHNQQPVLNGINLCIGQDESISVLGNSGSGKTVAIKTIIGLVLQNRGEVFINGVKRPADIQTNCKQNNIGVVFQNDALFDSMRVWQNIAFRLLNVDRVSHSEAESRAVKVLSAVDLEEEVAYKYISELSGGMRKRVAIARALISNPGILILDEPTTGLDPITSYRISEIIKRQTRISTVISVTHDPKYMFYTSNRAIMLYEGDVVWDGPPDQLGTSEHQYVRQFVRSI